MPGAPGIAELVALGVIAAALRGIAWARTAVLFNDGPIFLALAEAIGRGEVAAALNHPYHPGYPALVALTSALGLDLETAAVGVSIAGGLLAVGATYPLLCRLFDPGVARVGTWLAALQPWAVDFSSDVMSDGLYLGLFVVCLASAARALDERALGAAALAGGSGAAAYLVRPEAAALLAGLAIVFGIRWARVGCGRRSGASALAPLLVLLAVASAVALPYVAVLSHEAGELRLTQKKTLSVRGPLGPPRLETKLRERELARRAEGGLWLPRSARTQRTQRGGISLPAAVARVVSTSAAALRYEVVLLALVGFAWLVRSGQRPTGWRAALLFGPALVYSVVLVALVAGSGYVSRRHALPGLWPALGLAAVGVRAVLLGMPRSGISSAPRHRKRVVLALGLILLGTWAVRDVRPRRTDRLALRQAAEWLAATHPGSGPVAAQKLRTAYYARATFVPLPSGLEGPIEAGLRAEGARWLVIDPARFGDHAGLPEGRSRWLEPVERFQAGGAAAEVWRLSPEPAR